MPPKSADQSLWRLRGLRTREWPLDVDIYLPRAAAAALLLRAEISEKLTFTALSAALIRCLEQINVDVQRPLAGT